MPQGSGTPHPTYQYQPQYNETAATRTTSETAEQTAARLQAAARERLAALGLDAGPPMKIKRRGEHGEQLDSA